MKATDLQIGKVYRVYKEFKLTRKPTIVTDIYKSINMLNITP